MTIASARYASTDAGALAGFTVLTGAKAEYLDCPWKNIPNLREEKKSKKLKFLRKQKHLLFITFKN